MFVCIKIILIDIRIHIDIDRKVNILMQNVHYVYILIKTYEYIVRCNTKHLYIYIEYHKPNVFIPQNDGDNTLKKHIHT